jgi:hypothetical protein
MLRTEETQAVDVRARRSTRTLLSERTATENELKWN